MKLACRAVIFDLDGVLVDSNPIAERHWRAWSARHGLPFDEIARSHHGRTSVETVRRVAPHLDAETEARAKETAEADDTDGLAAYAGAGRLLAGLPPGQWAIVTSGTRRTATFRLRHVGLPEPSVLVTADDVARGKPAPDPYLLAAERLGVDPADCVVVEDAPAGIASAQAAGARVVGVASTNDPIALAGADTIVSRLDALRVEVAPGGLVVAVEA
jgi:mannitol-1-/sugar-/sorbitol-6-phosphatase